MAVACACACVPVICLSFCPKMEIDNKSTCILKYGNEIPAQGTQCKQYSCSLFTRFQVSIRRALAVSTFRHQGDYLKTFQDAFLFRLQWLFAFGLRMLRSMSMPMCFECLIDFTWFGSVRKHLNCNSNRFFLWLNPTNLETEINRIQIHFGK